MKFDPNKSAYYMNVLSERIDSSIRKALQKEGYPEIIPSYMSVLFELNRCDDGKMELLKIYKELFKPKSSVSDMANRLEKIGYLTKEPAPDNAKKVMLVATEKSTRLHETMNPELEAIIDQVYSGFTEEEKQEHIRLTMKACENLSNNP